MILSLAHASIRVRDLEVSKRFYQEVLGLKHVKDQDNESAKFAFFQIGETQIELIQQKAEAYQKRADGPVDHIAFFVRDLQEVVERLRKAEVVFLMDEIRETPEFKLIFIAGPDSERIELMEKR